MTSTGGAHGKGAVIKLSTNGNFAILYSFTGGEDGELTSGLRQGRDGSFYGTTLKGGKNGSGTLFGFATNGALTIMHHFSRDSDGAEPSDSLVEGRDGGLYGVASYGGPKNKGTVFRITTNGTFTVLYSFTGGDDGSDPRGPLVEGNDGSLYGVTQGSMDKRSTVFKLTTNGAFTTLHSFPLNGGPNSGLVLGNDGNLYGTTVGWR